MIPSIEEDVARIMKACPQMELEPWTDGLRIHIPHATTDRRRMAIGKRIYKAFPPGYRFMVHFRMAYGGGSANQPFTTGADPFPATYNGRTVTAVNPYMFVHGPRELLNTLINLNQLTP